MQDTIRVHSSASCENAERATITPHHTVHTTVWKAVEAGEKKQKAIQAAGINAPFARAAEQLRAITIALIASARPEEKQKQKQAEQGSIETSVPRFSR